MATFPPGKQILGKFLLKVVQNVTRSLAELQRHLENQIEQNTSIYSYAIIIGKNSSSPLCGVRLCIFLLMINLHSK